MVTFEEIIKNDFFKWALYFIQALVKSLFCWIYDFLSRPSRMACLCLAYLLILASQAGVYKDKQNFRQHNHTPLAFVRFYIFMDDFLCFIEQLYLSLHKIGCTSAIQVHLIAFGLHNLCIRLAAPRQNIQASLIFCSRFAQSLPYYKI